MADVSRHIKLLDIKILEERHRALDAEVDDAQRGRATDPTRLSWLKRQRLMVRDAIERLRAARQMQV
jgi:hypothetical protein